MDIEAKKFQLIEWIIGIHDNQMIDKLLSLAKKSDWWEEISDAERNSIERGLSDHSKQKTHLHSEVRENYEKYL